MSIEVNQERLSELSIADLWALKELSKEQLTLNFRQNEDKIGFVYRDMNTIVCGEIVKRLNDIFIY